MRPPSPRTTASCRETRRTATTRQHAPRARRFTRAAVVDTIHQLTSAIDHDRLSRCHANIPYIPYERSPTASTCSIHEDHALSDRRGQRLVPRRVEERAARAHRLCASVRAPDVRGLASTTTSGYFQPLQEAGALLNGSTNADRTNYWEVVPTQCARARAVDGIGSHGLSAAGADRREVREPARRRAERAPAELREPAVRLRRHGDRRRRCIRPITRITG